MGVTSAPDSTQPLRLEIGRESGPLQDPDPHRFMEVQILGIPIPWISVLDQRVAFTSKHYSSGEAQKGVLLGPSPPRAYGDE